MNEREADMLRAEIETLIRHYPEIAEDEVLRADMLDGETALSDVLTDLIRMGEDAKAMSTATKARQDDLKARAQRFDRRVEYRTTTKQEVLRERIEPMTKELPLQVVANNAKPVDVLPPRAMSREERRIIFEKLNEVYVNDKVGYSANWTDVRVAADLGVPLQWFKVIRDENFGDEVGNEDIRKQLAEAKEALALVRELEPSIKKLLALADRIERSIAECARVLK